jgi:hypothetical protein
MLTVDEAIKKHYEGPAKFARAWGIAQKQVSDWRKAKFMFEEVETERGIKLKRWSLRGEIEIEVRK